MSELQMLAIRVHEPGGHEALRVEKLPVPEPGAGEALVRVAASGVNFIDTYHRTGLYRIQTPFTPGQEGAGTVVRCGANVADLEPGTMVAWAGVTGSYAEYAVVPAERLVRVPEGVNAESAAAAMLQGMTAHYLSKSAYPLQPGDVCLVHAAAGGVGLLLVQMAELCGARVIGTVSTEEKAQAARRAGADEVIVAGEDDVVREVRRRTAGRGVDVVYDGVGQATFEISLACVRPRGMLVLFGNASGPVPPVDPLRLSAGGSLYLTRPRLADYIATREELEQRAGDVLEWVRGGLLRVRIFRKYALAEAAQAHRDLEARVSTGKLLLVPSPS
jgi:NADPH2:quinone reductase